MKANVGPIVIDHLRTLRDNRNGKVAWSDIAFFYGIPAALVVPVAGYGWKVSAVDNILAALALIAGLLFNLLILLFDTAVRIRDLEGEYAQHRRTLVRELQANVTYSLLIAILISALLGAISMSGMAKVGAPYSLLIVPGLAHFLLLLGLVLYRVRAAFIHEIGT